MATLVFYNKFKEAQLDGSSTNTPIDFDTDTIKVGLTTSTYVPNAATDAFWSTPEANEVVGTNYTAAGTAIGSLTVTESAGVVTVDGADVTWLQNAGGFANARFAVIYKDAGGATTADPLVGYIDFTADKGNVSGDLTIQWNASGIFTLT